MISRIILYIHTMLRICLSFNNSKGYNKIKHERDKHFKEANLENAILATSGLLTGILYFYDCDSSNHTIDSSQAPKLLVPQNNIQSGYQSASISWIYTVL